MTVPDHLVPVLKRKNLTKRLGTKSRAEAKRRSHEHVDAFLKIIADAALVLSDQAERVDIMAALQALDRWTNAERRLLLPTAFEVGRSGPLHLDFEWKLAYRRVGKDYYPGQVLVDPEDRKLLAALASVDFQFPSGVNVPESLRMEFGRCCEQLQREVEATRAGSREHLDRLNKVISHPSQAAPGPSKNATTLSMAFARWRSKRERGGSDAGKSAREFETQINRFVNVHGDLPLNEITRAHCIEFRDLMSKYPAHASKAIRQEPIRTVVARYTAKGAPTYRPLSADTLNEKVFAAVHAVLADAMKDDLLQANPMSSISVQDTGDQAPPKLPYNDVEVGKLFQCGVFRGQPIRDKKAGGDAQKWVPLLAAYSGARLEELGQLAITDVKKEGGVSHIHFQERYDGFDPGYRRSLKNPSSQRKVPIHSVLVGLGFLKFVEDQHRAGHIQLFPLLRWREQKKRDKSDKVTADFTKWWSSYSRTVVPDERKSFHSFRHTFKNRLRNAGVAKSLNDALTGHASSDEGDNYGRDEEGQSFELSILAEAIEKLSHPDIDVQSIR